MRRAVVDAQWKKWGWEFGEMPGKKNCLILLYCPDEPPCGSITDRFAIATVFAVNGRKQEIFYGGGDVHGTPTHWMPVDWPTRRNANRLRGGEPQ